MTPEDFKSRVSKFISGARPGINFGSFGVPRYTRTSSFIPKRSLPQQILERIQRKTVSDDDIGVESTTRNISSLGKISLNLEQTKNNLERILQVIAEDYKNTQETNRKEIDDYRKRIANRGRIFGKKDLGDKKVDIIGGVRKYVGSFFSGTGGALRALASFNLLQAILENNPEKIIKSLLGISITYLPAIGGMIAGGLAKSLVSSLFGGGRNAASTAGAAAGVSKFGKFGKLAGGAALLGGGAALMSNILNKPQQDTQQERLDQLTEQQKRLVDSRGLGAIPQDDLTRFENLNRRFEDALEFLLKKQKEDTVQPTRRSGGRGGGGGTPTTAGQVMSGPAPAEINALMSAISGGEGGLESVNAIGAVPGLSQMTIDEAIAKVEQLRMQGKTSGAMGNMQQMSKYLRKRTIAAGLDPSVDKFNQENQYKINRAYLASLFAGGEQEVVNLIRSGRIDQVVNKLKGVWPSIPGGNQQNVHTSSFYNRFQTYLRQLQSSPTIPPSPILPPLPRQRQTISTPPLAPSPTFVPMVIPQQSSPQQSSASAAGNDVVPNINTSYSENFLALYSKLTYQIV